MMKKLILTVAALIAVSAYAQSDLAELITPNATPQTKALYRNLKEVSRANILFGHHDANFYGHGWTDQPGRSDVKDVCGSHPAVYGSDFSSITDLNSSPRKQRQNENSLRSRIVDAHSRGGINTITWHFNNPVSRKSFYVENDSVRAVPMIIPGGTHHQTYKEVLQTIARFAQSLRDQKGELIPVIFRPYHEYDGNWFWWGVPHYSTKEEFFALWRFTVDYLRDALGVKNFIYGFSPDCGFFTQEEYLKYYPGDNYVDLLGMDNYWDLRPDGSGKIEEFPKKLRILSDVALSRKKVAALTETGLESIPDPKWWTDVLLHHIKQSGAQLSYVMVWRNDSKSPTHYYAPFAGHSSSSNFVEFRKDGFVLFEDDLKNMYQ